MFTRPTPRSALLASIVTKLFLHTKRTGETMLPGDAGPTVSVAAKLKACATLLQLDVAGAVDSDGGVGPGVDESPPSAESIASSVIVNTSARPNTGKSMHSSRGRPVLADDARGTSSGSHWLSNRVNNLACAVQVPASDVGDPRAPSGATNSTRDSNNLTVVAVVWLVVVLETVVVVVVGGGGAAAHTCCCA